MTAVAPTPPEAKPPAPDDSALAGMVDAPPASPSSRAYASLTDSVVLATLLLRRQSLAEECPLPDYPSLLIEALRQPGHAAFAIARAWAKRDSAGFPAGERSRSRCRGEECPAPHRIPRWH